MKSALFIGRFQPFHFGHLHIVEEMIKENDRAILVIGSAEKNFVPKNPLTAGERYQLIDAALQEKGISCDKYRILPVRNVNNYALWVNHINMYVPPYNVLYTGSDLVKACYSTHNVEIKQIDRRHLNISATEIRTAMAEGSDDWKQMVPKAVATLLEKWQIPIRIQTIQHTMDESKLNNSY